MSYPHRTILLVEDHRADVRLMELALKHVSTDVKLESVANGDQALTYLMKEDPFQGSRRPDLIFLDLNIPGRSGREILAKIKSDDALKSIPTIVLSSSNYSKDIQECYKLHANCYLRKPSSLEELEKLVSMVLTFWVTQAQLP